MPPSTQNSAPTLGVDKKKFVKIVISLNMWFKRHGLCKSMKKKKKYGHMKVQEEKNIGTHEGPKVLKKKMSTWRLIKRKKEMIAMSQNKKLERDHIYKRSIV